MRGWYGNIGKYILPNTVRVKAPFSLDIVHALAEDKQHRAIIDLWAKTEVPQLPLTRYRSDQFALAV